MVQLPTRRVPVGLKEPRKQELDQLSNIGVIQRVDTPTEWISAIVVTTKKNGKVGLCIDPKPLNQTLHRNHYLLPTIDDVLPLLSKARVFTVLNAKNWFLAYPIGWTKQSGNHVCNTFGEDIAGCECHLDSLQLRRNFRGELMWHLKGYHSRRL